MTHFDQAKQLRAQMQEMRDKGNELDVLSLPPRSEVHKNAKTRLKVKYPTIRLLAVFFILLPITILSIYYLYDKKPAIVVPREESGSYETIDIDSNSLKRDAGDTEQTKDNSSLLNDDSNESLAKNDQVYEEREHDVITHIVQENETLYSIAMKYYQSAEGMEIIKEWNELEGSTISKGQVLKIPLILTSK